ncbi:MAG: hypothetical protein ABEJ75_04320 [Candidatus Nanohaloarchaea archaeon]
MTGLDDAVERADYAMDDHYHAQEYLMDAIEDLESVLDDLESSGTAASEFERFAGVVADYLEEDTERTARQAAKIEDLTERLEGSYTGGYSPDWGYGDDTWTGLSWTPWMTQQQQMFVMMPGWGYGNWNDWELEGQSWAEEGTQEEQGDWGQWTDWNPVWAPGFQSQGFGGQFQYAGWY